MTTVLEKQIAMQPTITDTKRFLFAHWEGGGNTPPMLAVVRRLLGRGHEVRVLGDPCNRDEVEALGASFVPWERAPARRDKSIASDPLRDWEAKGPTDLLRRLCDHLFVGTALARAQDVLGRLEEFGADVIVTSEMLLGPMAAAEAAGVPCAALASNVYLYPLPGVPPFGPGFRPARTWIGCLRDKLIRSMSMKVFGTYTEAFNRARAALGLGPVSHPFDEIGRVQRVLVQTSSAFDFPATKLPDNVTYVGPELDDPAWAEPWRSPWPAEDRRPLVLVGFSTTFQDQAGVLSRVIIALAELDVRAVVTTGPAVDIAALPSAENVQVCRSAPHSQILPRAAAVISHCGHGTVIRALAAGVPLVCMPMGRDQNDNAVRVTARGAGVRIGPKVSPRAVRKAVTRVLKDPSYRAAAERLGRRIAEDARNSPVAEMLEELALRGSQTRERG
jgi:MGT family glycosyltransferase